MKSQKYIPADKELVSEIFGVPVEKIIDKGPDKIGGRNLAMPCPFPGCPSDNDGFGVSNGLYYCRQCGASGNLYYYATQNNYTLSQFREIRAKEAAEKAEREAEEKKRRARMEREKFPEIAMRAHNALMENADALEMLKERWGIVEEIVKINKIGLAYRKTRVSENSVESIPGFTLPYTDTNGNVVDIGWRILPILQKRYDGVRYRPLIPIGERAIGYTGGANSHRIWLVEGPLKAYKLSYYTGKDFAFVPGVASINMEFLPKQPKEMLVWYDEPTCSITRFAKRTCEIIMASGSAAGIVAPLRAGDKKADDIINPGNARRVLEWMGDMITDPGGSAPEILMRIIGLYIKWNTRTSKELALLAIHDIENAVESGRIARFIG